MTGLDGSGPVMNLNTSYVDIKLLCIHVIQNVLTYLNTSYVDIKLGGF